MVARSSANLDFVFLRTTGVYQGEECDPHSPGVSGPEEELCGAALQGEGIFCLDGGLKEPTGSVGQAALSGSQTKAPGFAEGYLLARTSDSP